MCNTWKKHIVSQNTDIVESADKFAKYDWAHYNSCGTKCAASRCPNRTSCTCWGEGPALLALLCYATWAARNKRLEFYFVWVQSWKRPATWNWKTWASCYQTSRHIIAMRNSVTPSKLQMWHFHQTKVGALLESWFDIRPDDRRGTLWILGTMLEGCDRGRERRHLKAPGYIPLYFDQSWSININHISLYRQIWVRQMFWCSRLPRSSWKCLCILFVMLGRFEPHLLDLQILRR